jgi:hypothetical protein
MNERAELRRCEGFHVLAEDGLVGEVAESLVPPDRDEPDYLVVRVPGRLLRSRLPVVSTALVSGLDSARRVVWVRGSQGEIASLPEHVPVAL